MGKFVLVALLAALSACAQESEMPVDEGTPAPATATALSMDDVAGTYDYTLADGRAGLTVMLADGTFTDEMGGEVVKGAWTLAGDKVCLDPEGEAPERKPSCFALGEPDAEGVQVATGDDGSVVKIRKQAA